MAIIIKANNGCATEYAVKFFQRYKDAFGYVVKAEMTSQPVQVEYKLVLTNDIGEEIEFNGECTAGYMGEGPGGTYRILKAAGFDVELEYIQQNKKFILEK